MLALCAIPNEHHCHALNDRPAAERQSLAGLARGAVAKQNAV
jgi:hypothetical protein